MKIFLIILLILFLIGQIRVGIRLELRENILSLWARFGAFRIRGLPRPEKSKSEQKPRKEKKPRKAKKPDSKPAETADKPQPAEKPAGPAKEKKPGGDLMDKVDMGLDYARSLLPIALELGKHFFHRLRIDSLHMVLTVGGPDPADAVMLYGRANAALGALWYPLTEAFRIEDGTARVAVNFEAAKPDLFLQAALSLKIGQILWIGLYFGLKGLCTFLSVRSRQKKKAETRKAV